MSVADGGHKPGGGFAPGHKYSRGRPPRNYSIAHALSLAAEEPESVDDHGNPLTKAQVLSKRLFKILLSGMWQGEKISYRDWLQTFIHVQTVLEPAQRITPGESYAAEQEEMAKQLDHLSDEELAVLEKIGIRR